MNLEDLRVMLVQSLGIEVSMQEKYIISHWKIANKIEKEILYFIDDETGLLYISTSFDEKITDNAFLIKLLKENLKLSGIKFCIDKDDAIMVMAEILAEIVSDEVLRRGIYAVYKATERFYELLGEFTES
ncbi:MAG TPA: hypothetical protein VKM55_18400 [Candidatus Lokiarchaeia archaeon]|nr:hypothetical protein [Candidatus Lokiarchaeia archaeon]